MATLRRIFLVLSIAAALGAACRPPVMYDAERDKFGFVVARTGTGLAVTMAELYDSLNGSGIQPLGGVVAESDVRYFLDSLLCDTLSVLRALEIDLSAYPDLLYKTRQTHQSAILNEFVQQLVYARVTVDSEAVYDFYVSRPDLFTVEEQVMARHIFVSPLGFLHGRDSVHYSALSAEQLRLETGWQAYKLWRAAVGGASFDSLARAASHDQGARLDGGDLGWVGRKQYKAPFDSVAFSLRPGEIAPPYEDEDGWHVILVQDRMEHGVPPWSPAVYGDVEEAFRNYQANSIGRPLFDSIRALPTNTVLNEVILDTNIYLVDPWLWAAVINERDTMLANEVRTAEEAFRRHYRVQNTTAEMKQRMVDTLAYRYLILQVARDYGIDTLPAVVEAERAAYLMYARTVVDRDRFDHAWRPDDSAVERYYRESIASFREEKPVWIQQIVARDSTFGEFLRDQAMAGVDFMELAMQYYPGEESIRTQLADLGYVGPDDVMPELYRASLTVSVGEVSHPVRSQYGWHVVKVMDRRETVALEAAKGLIVAALQKDHARKVFERFRDDLYRRYRVEFPAKVVPVHLRPKDQRP